MQNLMTRLLSRLKEIGISEAAFARLIGESGQTFHNWKSRGNIPSWKIAKVVKAARMSADALLGNQEVQQQGADAGSEEKRRWIELFDILSSEHRTQLRAHGNALASNGRSRTSSNRAKKRA